MSAAPRVPSPDSDADADLCAIPECGAPAERHLSLTEARRAFPELAERGRRAPLCRAHYKQWKKATKEARTLERLGH